MERGAEAMFHKINSVTAVRPYVLAVQFAEGVAKQYDVEQAFGALPALRAFKRDRDLFFRVRVDVGGHGIVWNDDLDLSCNELFERGVTIDTEFDGLMACSDAASLWGLNESTVRKAIASGRLSSGADACKYGKQWVVTRSAMIREFGGPSQSQESKGVK